MTKLPDMTQEELEAAKGKPDVVVDPVQQVVQQLAMLSPMEYDQVRESKATELGVRVTTLDKEVAKARGDVAEAASTNVVEELDPWPEHVDGVTLLDSIADSFSRHVVLPDGALTVVTLWSIGSFCMDAWRIWPKLLITSPEKRCGKSTLLEALEGLCYRPLLTSSITASSLFRCIEEWQPTLLIDEADCFAKDNDELNGIINAGHTKRTATVIRSEKEGDSFKPKKFSVWCPQVIAGIKSQRDTLHDRSIHIQMRRKLPGESVQKMPWDYFEEQETTRQRCLRWAADNISLLRVARPAVPGHGNDRAQDNWTPLFAIAELVGGQWPKSVLKAYQVMNARIDDDDGIGPMILSDIRAIFEERGVDRIWSDDLVDGLVAMEERPWCEWKHGKSLTKNSLSRLLKPFVVTSGTVRFGPDTKRGYKRKNFEDVWQRYLPSLDTPIQSDTTTQTSQGAGFSAISKRYNDDVCHFEKPLKASEGTGCVVVSLQNGDSEKESGNSHIPVECYKAAANVRDAAAMTAGGVIGGIANDLYAAASTACCGLNISAGEFISQLGTDDQLAIVMDPGFARTMARSMAARR